MLTMAARLRARDGDRASARVAGDFVDGENANRSPDTGDLDLQIKMVAGARITLYWRLCWTAA
jgi:hypothetical protein